MSNIKALDKLRELCADVKSMDFASVGCDAVLEIADEIEQEIAERYIELPVDADGVPIHVGDVLECAVYGNQTERFTVYGFTAEYSTWTGDVAPLMATNENATEFYCRNCRHTKPRTIEDVLCECCNEWNKHCGDEWESGVYAKYAEEIRGMMA